MKEDFMSAEELSRRILNLRRLEESETRSPECFDPTADMENPEEIRRYALFIHDLYLEGQKTISRLTDELSAMREMQANGNSTIERQTALIEKLYKKIDELTEANKALAKSNARLTEQLAVANEERYGSRSHRGSSKGKKHDDGRDRNRERDNFDGNMQTGPAAESAATSDCDSDEVVEPKHRTGVDPLRLGSTYNTMGASEVVEHRSSTDRLPEGAVLIRRRYRSSFERVTKIIQHKYEMLVFKDRDGRMHEAYMPAEGEPQYIDMLPGTHASASYMAGLAVDKYVMHTPFFRSLSRLTLSRMSISRQTLVNWARTGAEWLGHLIPSLKDALFSSEPVVNCDETWTRVVLDGKKKCYMWCMVNRESRTAMFFYDKGSRSRATLREFVGGHKVTALQSDGYNVYAFLDEEVVDCTHLCCMAHARAKFKKALLQGQCAEAGRMLELIGALYHREETYRRQNLSSGEVLRERQSEQSQKIKRDIREELDRLMGGYIGTGDSLLAGAVRYMHNLWDPLFRYMEDGRYSIDNNISERAIRPFTMERKNAPVFCSHRGVEVSAIYHTIIETCRMMGYNVYDYLHKFFTEIIMGRRDYENLLPNTIGIPVMTNNR